MTASAELLKTAQNVEYILCVEGLGWPADEADLSSGFQGTLFVTADQAGDLATQLIWGSTEPTIYAGLMPSGSASEQLDTRTGRYTVSSMDFEITDVNDFLLANFSSHRSYDSGALSAAVDYSGTSFSFDTDFATGVFFIGREAVLIGSTSGSGPYVYSGCTRGYLGTPRGRVDNTLTGDDALAWSSGMIGYSLNLFWEDRRVALYMHMPGEAASGCLQMWTGKLRNVEVPNSGNVYRLAAVGDVAGAVNRVRKSPNILIRDESFTRKEGYAPPSGLTYQDFADPQTKTQLTEYSYQNYRRRIHFGADVDDDDGYRHQEKYNIIRAAYQYRTEPGGTAGMKSASQLTPQAMSAAYDNYVAYTLFSVGDNVVRCLKKDPDANIPFDWMLAEVTGDWANQWNLALFEKGAWGRFLLDNFRDEWRYSRFAINKRVTRNPVDVLLIFLTSTPNEYFIGDTTAGCTSSVLNFSACGPANIWAGAALHCVEGVNAGQARTITSNTTTSITVDRPFDSAPASGKEYQVRSSVYDVLPIGWGLAKHWNAIDIASFEEVRDKYLANARLGKFAIGNQDSIDLWEMLQKNICEPYGILMYNDRTTGKLTARYIGSDALGDGIDQTYVTVSESQFVAHPSLNYNISKPVGKIELSVRDTERAVVSIIPTSRITIVETMGTVSSVNPFDGKTTTIDIIAGGFDAAFLEDGMQTVKVESLFNTIDDASELMAMLAGRIKRLVRPPPIFDFNLDIGLYPDVQIGKFLSMTHSKAVNPFTGARGWNSVVGRVIGTELPVRARQPMFRVRVELLGGINAAKIAPAANIASKGSDANGNYFETNLNDFGADNDARDYKYFAVGDVVRWFDRTGATVQALGAITGFGTNFASDPANAVEGATTCRIYVSIATITPAVGTGDFLSFNSWSVATARQRDYSAYSGSATGLSGGDPPKVFA